MSARRFPALGALAAALLYAGIMAAAYPYRDVFAFDPDEGINAGKALLLERGALLYAQVWNDQPPLFTYLLRGWCNVVGWTVADARLLVLLFAALLVFAVADIGRLEGGPRAGAIAALAFAASSLAPRLSVSLMIGLPAIALATLAVWALFRWLHGGRDAWLPLAGALFAASLATKLITACLLPVVAAWLWLAAPPARRVRALTLWLGSTLLVGAALLLALVGPAHFDDLVRPHLAARSAPGLQKYGNGGLLVTTRAEWALTALGWIAFARLARQRRLRLLLFPAWVVAGAAALLAHHPVWYHHQLLLSVPYCPAIGVVLADALARRRAGAPALRLAPAAALLLLAGLAIQHVFFTRPPAADVDAAQAVAALRAHLGARRVALAGNAMYAFRAGATMPPALAVLSGKRAATDPGLERDVAAAFAGDAAPEVVLMTADMPARVRAAVARGMATRYVELPRDALATATVAVRRDLLATAAPR
ncbi:MAG: glycosyltransferase family 39 protein [Deltaproteobacteria bacterium]|nr:glycosyltransferase family 39 protein [Deltaproteobacteria bacterium]